MNKRNVALVVMALVMGVGAGYWLSGRTGGTGAGSKATADGPCPGGSPARLYRNAMNPEITSPVPAKDNMGMDYVPVCAERQPAERKVLFYRNPMNPEITSPVPAKDNMGMDYIPVYAEADGSASEPAGTVAIDPTMVQTIGVRTASVGRKMLARTIRTVGRVTYDEERVARLHPKVDGWIDRMFVDKTGEHVKKGTMLLAVYSPQLVSSAEEYVLALNNYDILKESPFADIRDGARRLVSTARARLLFLDVAPHQLAAIEETRQVSKNLHIHSPFDGNVITIGAREGSRITPETELYMIADLSRIWVLVDIYEDEIPWARVGDMAEMKVASAPGRMFRGKVSYIYPYLEAETRSVKVRLEFENPDLALKPDMFANVTLLASRQEDAIVVPSEAIVRSGTSDQVFVVRDKGKFEPRPVTTGISADGFTQILAGVQPGEKVVTSSQFLIDSESKLKEATAKMMRVAKPEADEAAAGLGMQGMDMGAPPAAKSAEKGMQGMDMHAPPAARAAEKGMQGMDMGKGKGDGREE